jgi:hypothetical protein
MGLIAGAALLVISVMDWWKDWWNRVGRWRYQGGVYHEPLMYRYIEVIMYVLAIVVIGAIVWLGIGQR